jgi:hypothetical protein
MHHNIFKRIPFKCYLHVSWGDNDDDDDDEFSLSLPHLRTCAELIKLILTESVIIIISIINIYFIIYLHAELKSQWPIIESARIRNNNRRTQGLKKSESVKVIWI